jgi:hypothetical protein
MSVNNTVLQGGRGWYSEHTANGASKPGHLLQRDSNNKVKKHATYGGEAERLFAKEDALQSKTVTDAYADGDTVFDYSAAPGERIQARLPALAAAVVIGDKLISNGDGCLVKKVAIGNNQLYGATAASGAVSNTTVTTNFDNSSYTIPANTLQVGDVITIKGQGIATATNSTDTLSVGVKIGSTALFAPTGVDVANNDIFAFEVNIQIRSIGASGTFVADAMCSIGAAGTGTVRSYLTASTTIDTTAAQTIAATGTWSVANAGNSCRLDLFEIAKDSAASGTVLAIAHEAIDNSAGSSEAFCAVTVL